jgi:ribosomal protein L37E
MGTIYKTGLDTWEHGAPFDYYMGKPRKELLGPCPRCGSRTSSYGGGMDCHKPYCANNSDVFAHRADPFPEWWNTDVQVYVDGDMWCAVGDGFTNIQESPCGFGRTPNEAVKELRSK